MGKVEEEGADEASVVEAVLLQYSKSILDSKTKFKIRVSFITASFLVGLTFICLLDLILALFGYYAPALIPTHTPTPPIHFHIQSLNLSNPSSKHDNLRVILSLQNPLPFPLHIYSARASLSYKHHHLLGSGLMHSFTVLSITPSHPATIVSTELSFSIVDPPRALGGEVAAGIEFRVDGLVKIGRGSKKQRMRSMKVVCGDLEVWFSSDFNAARLVGGPNKCVHSWGGSY